MGESLERATIAKISRRVVPFIGLLYVVNYIDRINLSFAALTMNKAIGLDSYYYGLGAGVFFFGYFIFEVPSNIILERVGARIWIARIMVSWGIVSAGMAFITGPTSFLIVRFLLGLAEAGFFPGMILYLTYWFPAAYRARVIGAFMVAIPISIAIGAPISTNIMELDGLLGFAGWQWLFLTEGAPAVLLGIYVLFHMTDRPSKARWLKPEERDWLERALQQERLSVEAAHSSFTLFRALVDPRVLGLAFVYFGLAAGGYGMVYFLPQIIKGLGFSNYATGYVTSVPYLFGTAGMLLWGWYSDRVNERRWNLAASCLCAAVGLIGVGVFGGSYWGLAAMSVAAIGLYGSKPCFWPVPSIFLSGTAAAGAIAAINSIGNLGGYVGPFVVGWIKSSTGSFSAGLYFLGGLSVLAAIVALVAAHPTARRTAPAGLQTPAE
jgi:ACS family tartrate transporter-like MFS transporter